MSNINDFVIENGELKKYKGQGGDVVIPEGVTSIGNWAFNGCSSLTSVVIPEGVTSIGARAFYGCKGLADANGFVIVQNALHGYYGKGGDVVIPEGVTSIGWGAFAGCSSLTSVVIPEGVTSIGEGAFAGCSSLTSVVIPEGVTSIDNWAFKSCKSLTSVVIPEGVTSIGASAFNGCSSLASVVIPESVTSIDRETFRGCSGLKLENAPAISVSVFNSLKLGPQAGYIFLSERDRFKDEVIVAGYKKYSFSQRKKLLPLIFRDDNDEALRFYIDEKKVTAKNFDTDYFVPALQVGAEKCKALLLEWKEQH